MILNTQSVIVKNKTILENEIDGEKIMMNIDNGEYYGLDKIASHIWELLDNEIVIDDLLRKLLEEYDTDYENCKTDVLEFVTTLINKNLVVIIK